VIYPNVIRFCPKPGSQWETQHLYFSKGPNNQHLRNPRTNRILEGPNVERPKTASRTQESEAKNPGKGLDIQELNIPSPEI